MSAGIAVPEGRLTIQQFHAWAERQPERRYELVDGVPCAMSPERNIHAIFKAAVYRALRDAVIGAGLDHLVLVDGPMVAIDRHRSRQPDVIVLEGAKVDLDAQTVDRPCVLVEVTSPTTMRTDTDDKLIDYFSLPSVRHYVLVHPVLRRVVHHRRDDAGAITSTILAVGDVRFDSPGIALAIETFFRELDQ